MELGGRPHALRMSLIDVAAYPRVAISRSVASRISSRDCSPCCCFFVGRVSVGIITDRLTGQSASSQRTHQWHAEAVSIHTDVTADELLGLFPPGTAIESDGTLTVGGCRLDEVA